jgi:hypothetical protein
MDIELMIAQLHHPHREIDAHDLTPPVSEVRREHASPAPDLQAPRAAPHVAPRQRVQQWCRSVAAALVNPRRGQCIEHLASEGRYLRRPRRGIRQDRRHELLIGFRLWAHGLALRCLDNARKGDEVARHVRQSTVATHSSLCDRAPWGRSRNLVGSTSWRSCRVSSCRLCHPLGHGAPDKA